MQFEELITSVKTLSSLNNTINKTDSTVARRLEKKQIRNWLKSCNMWNSCYEMLASHKLLDSMWKHLSVSLNQLFIKSNGTFERRALNKECVELTADSFTNLVHFLSFVIRPSQCLYLCWEVRVGRKEKKANRMVTNLRQLFTVDVGQSRSATGSCECTKPASKVI